jgi:hypothetical protein
MWRTRPIVPCSIGFGAISNKAPSVDVEVGTTRLRACMTFVPHSRILPRSLWRPALLFFAVAQVFLSFAPLLEGREGPDARAHIEESGTTLHHAHNESDCSACVARHLLSTSDPEPLASAPVESRALSARYSESASVSSAATTLVRSRGPPAPAFG